MKFRVLKNMIKQGFQGMWRNRSMGLASVGSISAVLVILGIILILILSINNAVFEIQTKFDEIQIFLEDGLSIDELVAIENRIKSDKNVVSIIFIPKSQGLERMREEWGEEAHLLEGLEENNPLEDSYEIKLKDIKYADVVVDELKNIKEITQINYYKDIIDKLMMFANYIRFGGLGLVAILVLVSVFIISNTIKITVASREREINIMKYVGATNGYIRGPFIIEGILFGLIGAGISILIINYGYKYFFQSVNDELYILFTVYLVSPTKLVKDIIIIFSSIGIGIGGLGSIISLKRFLNV